MITKRLCLTCMMLLGGALLLSGCYEWIAWSPDGRYVVFRDGEASLQLYDTQTKTGKRLLDGVETGMLRYFPSGDSILVAVGSEDRNLVKVDVATGARTPLLENIPVAAWDMTPDGKQLYALIDEGAIVRVDIADTSVRKEIIKVDPDHAPGFIRLRPGSKELLCCAETSIFRVNIEDGTRVGETLTPSGAQKFIGVSWIDENRFTYYEHDENDDDELATLYLRDTTTNTSKKILERCYYGFSPAVDSVKRYAYVTRTKEGADVKDQSAFQITRVSIADGTTKILTDAAYGAFNPSLSPDGKRLAYLEGIEDEAVGLAILDLDSEEITRAAPLPEAEKE